MARVPIPLVVNEDCFLAGHMGSEISMRVGSSDWYAWLEDELHTSFAFRSEQRVFTARRERQRHGWYWYAYRKHQGKTYKVYLGKSQELHVVRLQGAAHALASRCEPIALPGVPIVVPSPSVVQKSLLTRLKEEERAAHEEMDTPLEPVTERERDVLSLLVEGASNREIAQQLIISEGTVKKHVSNICSKFGVRRRAQVITRALLLL